MIKNVLYVGGFELPDCNAGACRVLNNARILKQNGMNVAFFGITKNSNQNIEGVALDECKYHLETIKSKNNFLKYSIGFSFAKKAVKYMNNIDLIVCYSLHAANTKWLIKFAKKNNIKIIIDCVEWDISNKLSLYNILKNIDVNICMKKIYKKADGIICISSFLQSYFCKKMKTVIIPPLTYHYDFAKFYNSEKLNDNEVLKLVYFGDPGEKENFSMLIDVVVQISKKRDVLLNFIGFDKNTFLIKFKDEYQQIIKNSIEVAFHGRLSHKQVIKTISNCDCSLIFRKPSLKNSAGFPTKFAESISAQLYTICNNFSDLMNYNFLENVLIINNDFTNELSSLVSSLQKKSKSKNFVSPFDISCWSDKLINFIKTIE